MICKYCGNNGGDIPLSAKCWLCSKCCEANYISKPISRNYQPKSAYIAHPLRGDVQGNIERVNEICKQLSEEREIIPLSPLHAFGFLDPTGCQKTAMNHCYKLLSLADELHLYGEWWNSEGCKAEIHYAITRGIPVKIHTVPPLGITVCERSYWNVYN